MDAGIDRTYVSRMERGLENPSVAVLERLSKALHAEIVNFFDAGKVAKGPVQPLPGGRRRKT